MTKIKICGITNLDDALACLAAGADAVGFVFAQSPRKITPEKAAEICGELSDSITRIGVFVNENIEAVHQITSFCGLNLVQLSGEENGDYWTQLKMPFLKVFRVKGNFVIGDIERSGLSLFMLDTYSSDKFGGTGNSFDWEIAFQAKKYGNFFLSGGLTPGNVTVALEEVAPFGVDVSSGVEKCPGKKELDKVKQFIAEVRKWDSQTN